MRDSNLPAGADTPDAPFNQPDDTRYDGKIDADMLFEEMPDPYAAISECTGPDAWNGSLHEDSLFEAIIAEDWCEVGMLIGIPAREYLIRRARDK
jgi:hypothetical protein